MELPKKRLTKYDIFIILTLTAVVIVFAVRSVTAHPAEYFVIQTPDSTETHPLDGSGSYSFVLNGIYVDILHEDHSVRITKSECPDQTCVNSKAISKPGESIVCVPAELVIRIPSGGASEANEDFIIG